MVEDQQGTLGPAFLIRQEKLVTAKGIVLAVPLSRSPHPIIHSMYPVPKQLSRMNDFQTQSKSVGRSFFLLAFREFSLSTKLSED